MAVDIEKVRKSLEVCPIKWVGDGKFTNEILDERHVRVVVPVEGLHLNHVGIVYDGTMFTAMELAAGNSQTIAITDHPVKEVLLFEIRRFDCQQSKLPVRQDRCYL